MSAVRVAAASCCILLLGCEMQTEPSTGRTVLAAPSLAGLFGGAGQPVGSATDGPPLGRPIRYVAATSGRTTHLTLTRQTATTWLVQADMGQPDCFGTVTATATQTSPGMLTTERDVQGNVCRLAIRQTPRAASMGELGCGFDHGAACEFVADLVRTH